MKGLEMEVLEHVSTHRGYKIFKKGPTSFKAAGAWHGSVWSAICYIDELLTP